LSRKKVIEDYWTESLSAHQSRFQSEIKAFTNLSSPNFNDIFSIVLDAVEITALQRGVERWEP
jgi:hypothetical protein